MKLSEADLVTIEGTPKDFEDSVVEILRKNLPNYDAQVQAREEIRQKDAEILRLSEVVRELQSSKESTNGMMLVRIRHLEESNTRLIEERDALKTDVEVLRSTNISYYKCNSTMTDELLRVRQILKSISDKLYELEPNSGS